MGPQKPTCLKVFMVNHLVFRWPKFSLFFHGLLEAHGGDVGLEMMEDSPKSDRMSVYFPNIAREGLPNQPSS